MRSVKVNCAIAFTIITWASAFVGIRFSLMSYSPGALALLRFIIASIAMAVLYPFVSQHKKMPSLDQFKLALLGVAGVGVYHVCLNYGEMTVTAGAASFVIGLVPMIIVFLSVIFLHEHPGWATYLGLLIGFLGFAIIAIAESNHASLGIGVVLVFISAWMGALLTVCIKPFLKQYHVIIVSSWIVWGGTLVLLWFGRDVWHELPLASISATWSAMYLGLFPSAFAYLTWSYALSYLPASRVAMFLYAMPIVATSMEFIILDERTQMLSICGGIVALAGTFCAAHWSRK